MSNKEMLNEQNHKKIRKTLLTISLTIFLISLLISLFTLLFPAINNLNKANEYDSKILTSSEITKKQEKLDVEKEKKLEALEKEYTNKKKEIESKYKKQMGSDGWFEEQQKKNKEIFALSSEELKKSSEITSKNFKDRSKVGDASSEAEFMKNDLEFEASWKIALGVFIILVGIMISGFIALIANGRKFLSFAKKSTTPIVKGAFDEMLESVKKAKMATKETCKSCGALIDIDDPFCPHCKAVR